MSALVLNSTQTPSQSSASGGARQEAAWRALRQDNAEDLGALLRGSDASWALGLKEHGTGRSLLASAVFLHRHATLRLLLDAGGDPDGLDGGDAESTLLTRATASRCLACVEALIEAGANVDFEDPQSKTPLISACLIKSAPRALELSCALLDAGADVAKVSSLGYFPLASAAQVDNDILVRELVKRGAPVDTHTGDGYTALFYAVENDARRAIEELLRAGADLSARAQAEFGSGSGTVLREVDPLELAAGRSYSATLALLYAFSEARALREKLDERTRETGTRRASKSRL